MVSSGEKNINQPPKSAKGRGKRGKYPSPVGKETSVIAGRKRRKKRKKARKASATGEEKDVKNHSSLGKKRNAEKKGKKKKTLFPRINNRHLLQAKKCINYTKRRKRKGKKPSLP